VEILAPGCSRPVSVLPGEILTFRAEFTNKSTAGACCGGTISGARGGSAFGQILYAPSNQGRPTGCNKARGQQRSTQTGGPRREEADRFENTGVESRDSRYSARHRHGLLSGPGRAASSGDTVQGLYDALLSTMKNGRTLGQSGRFMQLRDSRSPIF
jgi:hypothetical protein